ncbi:13852_t:CDS:1, partial [Racocetra persica]
KILVKSIDSLPDGTIIVRIMREMDKNDQKIFYDPILSLRFIHPNGSVTEINNKYGIPDYNFHYPIYHTENNGYKSDDKFNPLDFYPLYDNYILVVYSTASDWTDNETLVDRE